MRVFLVILTFVFGVIFILNSSPVYAHGGVQKRNSDYIITFYQNPISPLVDEKVVTTFIVSDNQLKSLEGIEGTLTLIDTYYGDESKDKVILQKPFQTDANGAFEFEYTFNKENYFTIELQFQDKEKSEHIDFLIQTREPNSYFAIQELQKRIWLFVGITMIGMLVGAIMTFVLLTVTLRSRK